MKKSVSLSFRQYCLCKYPALQTSEAYRRMFQWMCFGTFHDEDTEHLLIPASLLAEFEKKSAVKAAGNYAAYLFLESFKRDVLPKMMWRDAEAFIDGQWTGKCRSIIRDGMDAEMIGRLTDELATFDPPGAVFFVSGQSYYQTTKAKEIENQQLQFDHQIDDYPLNATQKLISDYLRTVPSKAFSLRLSQNKKEILSAISQIENNESRADQMRILHAIAENPNVNYLPSRRGRTCRLFHSSDCVVGLKKEVRKVFCHGWSDIDLKSSQFAILAQILDAPLAKAFFNSGEDLWSYMEEQIFLIKQKPSREHKKIFKAIIYGICFGKMRKTLKKDIKKMNGDVKLFMDNAMIKELLERRDAWFEAIREHGYVTDAWNNRIEVSKERWIGAVAAAKIQSIEMEIIASVFEMALQHEKSDAFKIMIFQHDGITVSFYDKGTKERVIRKMQEAVAAKSQPFGFNAKLDVEDL